MPSVYPKNYLGEAVRQAPKVIKASDFLHAFASIGIVANENAVVRSASRAVALRALAGIGGRVALPALGLALTAYDLYRLYEWIKAGDALADLPKVSRVSSDQHARINALPEVDPIAQQKPLQLLAAPMILDLTGWSWNGSTEAYPATFQPKFASGIFGQPVSASKPSYSSYWGAAYDHSLFEANQNAPMDWFINPMLSVIGFANDVWYPAPEFPLLPDPVFGSPVHAFFWNKNVDPNVRNPVLSPGYDYPSWIWPSSPLSPLYTIDPASVPVVNPLTTPSPIPYSIIPRMRTNPWRYEKYQREAGYRVGPEPIPADALPLAVPSVALSTSPAVARKSQPLAKFHYLRKPPKGTKERKIRTKGYLAVNAVIGTVTEGVDAIYAVYKALPRSVRPRRQVTPQEALRLIYQNYEVLDVCQAGKNLILNEVQDRIYGSIGQGLRNAAIRNRPHGELPIGYQAGPAL